MNAPLAPTAARRRAAGPGPRRTPSRCRSTQIDVSKPRLFQEDTVGHYFERLRRDDPVHFTENPFYGRFWSVTKYKDIMAVDTNHGVYSSDCTQGGIALWNAPDVKQRLHDVHRDGPAQARRAAQGGAARSSRRTTWRRWRR